MVGETISHYKVLEKIGEGGMGEVYLAQDTTLDRKIALKFLPQEMQQDTAARKRFLREAKSAAALDHPYICHIHEVGEAEEKSFISMEYVQGETLQDKLSKGPLPLNDALEKATEITEALEAAHKQKIVHRDLKPSNIMLTPEGHVKVMDFGLAKRVTPVEGQEEEITTRLTKDDSILGTVPYMSPEQLRGQEVDPRTDIFSFGVVLYEMLAGVNPFVKGSVMDTATAILSETVPPLTRYSEDIPVLLQHTVKKMLAKEPDRRYQLIHEVRTDLGDLIGESGDLISQVTARPSETVSAAGWWHRAIPWSIAVVAVVAVVLMSLRSQQTSQSVARLPLMLPLDQQLTYTGRHVVSLSPDGTHLVYVANSQLYLRAMDQFEATPIGGTEGGGRSPFFSPDGQWVGFWDGTSELKTVSISGGAPVTLCETEIPYGASWGVDDTVVFGLGRKGIWKVSAAGGTPEVLVPLGQAELAHGPQILPGGRAVLFTLKAEDTGSWDQAQIVVQSLENDERQVLIEGGRDARYLPTGHLVYVREGTLLATPFDLARLQVTGGAVPLVEGVMDAGRFTGAAHFSVSSMGSLVYLPGGAQLQRNTLVWVDRQGQETPLTEEYRLYSHPRLSPDGKRVGVDIASGSERDIWIYDIERKTHTRLTFEGNNSYPVWTPDGKRVTFASDRSGSFDLYWKSADGSGEAELLNMRGGGVVTWSPDGRFLAFEKLNPTTGWDISVLPLEGDGTLAPFLVTSFSERAPMFSPDGHWLAYVSNESGNFEVYVQPYPGPGGKWQISTNGGTEPLWSADGRELFYRQGNRILAVAVQTQPTLTAGTPEEIFSGSQYAASAAPHLGYDVSADSQNFLMRKRDIGPTRINVVLNWLEELKERVPGP